MFKAYITPTVIIITTFIFITNIQSHAAVIAAWDFNGGPPDSLAYTGTLAPSAGQGEARPIGGVRYFFQKGSSNDPSTDNSSWGMNGFPPQETGNKTAGAEFKVNTVGYRNLRLEFEAQSTPAASRLYRVQYSTNGIDFIDDGRLELPATNGFAAFSHIIPVDGFENHPGATVRIVTEFERTIVFTGKDAYLATDTNRYSSYGIVRFDLVRLIGDPINPANTSPTISAIDDLAWPENEPGGPVLFSINDSESQPDDLVVIAESTDPGLVPPNQIQITGSGPGRALTITPIPNRFGKTTVRVTVIDPEGAWVSEQFDLSVASVNIPPGLTGIPNLYIERNTSSGPIAFGTEDEDTPLDRLHLSASSTNRRLIKSIRFGGEGAGRTVEIIPATNAVGTAVVTLVLSDGRDTVSTRFAVVVAAPPEVAAYDSFEYADGDLATASASAWAVHGQGTAPVRVSGGKVHLTGSGNQDVNRPLPGAPYSDETPVYSGLTVRFSELPTLAGSYFAHLNTSSFRARLFAHQANATPGLFRMGISNGVGTRSEWPADLNLDQDYRIVVRFNPAQGQTALWINPENEGDPSIEAVDNATPTPITAFALRQAAGIGTLTVDELKCGQSFNEIMAENPADLSIRSDGEGPLLVSWPLSKTRYRLQSAVNDGPLIWADVETAPEQRDEHWVVEVPRGEPEHVFRLVTP